jgi:hypothetical protein
VEFQAGVVDQEVLGLAEAERQRDDLLRQQEAGAAFDQANQWRLECIESLEAHLKLHWSQAVLDAASDGHPVAYGTARLQAARNTLIDQIENLAAHPVTSQPEQPADSISDPLFALRELDRAIRKAAE